ncbi:MAG: transglutaminase domain-containing protein [Phycisphaerales bacterium]|nr:MAG: transglutaminase domain-containing protein [Phycisphaerales bacterium]
MRIRCLGIVLLALVVLGAGCRKKPDSARQSRDEELEYLAIFMEGKKVGHAIQSRVVDEGRVTTRAEASITISRANVPITVAMTETSIETPDGKPLAFESVQDMAVMKMQVKGVIEPNGTVNLAVTSMGSEQKSTMEWPQGALMAEGLSLLTRQKGLKEGLEYSAKVFSPQAMQAFEAKIHVGSRQDVDLLGRVVPLTEVATTLNIPGAGEIVSTDYLDDELRTLKSIVPVAGIKVEMIACTKEFALGENDVFEVIDKMFLASPEPLEDVGRASSITYYLSPKKDAEFTIPSNDNQQVERLDDGRVVLTVRPVAAAPGAKFPYGGRDKIALEALKPTRFVQSDRKEIIDLARRAVGKTKDAAAAVRKIEVFVGEYVENKSLSVGYASAAEVAASKQGDCSEFAVLTAALCRAVGIPAQVVTGVAYVDDFRGFQGFGGHAWTQAYVGGKWVGLDAAFKGTGRGGYDAGHIALAAGNGDPEGFFDLVTTLGQFKIDKLVVENGR